MIIDRLHYSKLLCMFKYVSRNIEIKCQNYDIQEIVKVFRKFMRAYPIFFETGSISLFAENIAF